MREKASDRRQRGASLVEYAGTLLMLTFLAVPAVRYLGTRAFTGNESPIVYAAKYGLGGGSQTTSNAGGGDETGGKGKVPTMSLGKKKKNRP